MCQRIGKVSWDCDARKTKTCNTPTLQHFNPAARMIELRDVSKRYGDFPALQSTTLQFQSGKTTALIGPSGCGKSTMLRLILGLIQPTTGNVLIDNTPVSNWLQARRRMGFVVQDGGLFPHLNAFGNVAIMARHLGKPMPEIQKRVKELCSLTRFPSDAFKRYTAELSG